MTRFVRIHGHVVPIKGEPTSRKIGRIAKGAAKDAAVTGAFSAVLSSRTFSSRGLPLREAAKAGAKMGLAWGGVSLGVRALATTWRAAKKRREK